MEPNTYFAKFPPQLPEDDLAYQMMDRITELTGVAGLERYEVSAYARRGHRCTHNLNYWGFGDYLGIGAGAHGKLSFAHRVMRQVPQARAAPVHGQRAGRQRRSRRKPRSVTRAELPFEFMLNALRLKEGFALQDFRGPHRAWPLSLAIEKPLGEAEAKGLIERDFASG